MDIRRLYFFVAFLISGLCLANAAEQMPPAPAKPGAPVQVDPNSDLAALYPGAGSIGLALAILPDPHIPRYRRLFDLEIQAITLGMLNDGYVLDRIAFPWNNTISNEKDPRTPPSINDPDHSAFGLLIFRCDGWRGHVCQDLATLPNGIEPESGQTTRIRAVYLVTDTATWGVAARPLICAARKIREHLPGAGPIKDEPDKCHKGTAGTGKGELLRFPGRCAPESSRTTLVVMGPNFSGAMDSIGENLGEILGPNLTDLCLVSSTTTESSNQLVEKPYSQLHYVRLAVTDAVKLLRLADLAQAFGYFDPDRKIEEGAGRPRNNDVAFFAEASTFGFGVCNSPAQLAKDEFDRINKFCRDAYTLYFPAAIADIRYGIDQQRERLQNNVQTAMKAALPSEHLALDVGADNGSEFPENRQAKLTAASQQLALDHVLDQLEQFRPKMVVVIATDVRDRLFLFDQLRRRLPSAMLIDLETDILLAHPDFLHASRGAVTVASANLFVQRGKLFGCERGMSRAFIKSRVPLASWALDGQGMLADAVSRLYDSGQTPTASPCIVNFDVERYGVRAPILHVVTLKGLRRISRVVDLRPVPGSWADRAAKSLKSRPRNVLICQLLSVLCCFAVVLPWLWIGPLRRPDKPALTLEPWEITLGAGVAGTIVWIFAMRAAYAGEDIESGFALVYWSVTILALALGGLYQCLKRVKEAKQLVNNLPWRHRYALAAVGLFACALAGAPIVAGYLLPPSMDVAVNPELLTRLSLDISQGLAYDVVNALGVVTVLAVMISLATGLCILVRNNYLLGITAKSRDSEPGARSPQFPMSPIVGIVFLIALIAVPSLITPLGGPRLTIFGPTASLIATVVLVVTTLGASIFTAVAIHSSRRVRTIAAHIGRCVASAPCAVRAEPPGEYPGLWPASEWQPDLFAATPVVARVGSGVVKILNADKEHPWKTLVSEFLGKCEGGKRIDDGQHRRAMFALLASEVSLYRWFVGGAVLCAIASVCAAYLFPLEADALLMWNLMVLVVHAFLAGYVATSFERDGVLSNILCNRPKKAAFSASLFTYAALPFFALGFAIAVSQVPGVVDWGGGLLALLSAIGISL